MYDRNLIEYLPEFLRSVKEYEAILTLAEQPEMVELWKAEENALNDQFVVDSTEYGVSRWEKILGIVPKATDSLDVRKFSILTRINEQLPFTITTLKEQLKSLCGEDGYEVNLDASKFILSVKVALTAKSNFDDVNSLLKRVVPANLVVDLSLKYNKNNVLKAYTHGQLESYTHNQLRNEAVTNGN
jgi:hypothetical protein